jgi:parvulin-like peptidyl-prolyl isomerase
MPAGIAVTADPPAGPQAQTPPARSFARPAPRALPPLPASSSTNPADPAVATVAAAPPVVDLPGTAAPTSTAAPVAEAPIVEPPPAGPTAEDTFLPATPGKNQKLIGLTVAHAGNQAITLTDLQSSLREWKIENVPQGRSLAREELDMIAGELLEHLIDRSLLVQEAKQRFLKDEKKLEQFYGYVDERWRDQEMPRLLRKNHVASEQELRAQFEKAGRSLDRLRENYRLEILSQEFLREQIKNQLVRPELREMYTYYNGHLKDFHQPARVVWREIVIKSEDDAAARATARARAAAALDRLRRGEPFEAVARSCSEGPTAEKGGLWETEPSASAVPAVNHALATLARGQTSAILEGPRSLHIVKVEQSRPAGPIAFEEAQDRIRTLLQEDQVRRVTSRYLDQLRARHTVVTRFDLNKPREAPADPAALRTSQPVSPP